MRSQPVNTSFPSAVISLQLVFASALRCTNAQPPTRIFAPRYPLFPMLLKNMMLFSREDRTTRLQPPPSLHLKGDWLDAAGFSTDTPAIVAVERGQLVIRAAELKVKRSRRFSRDLLWPIDCDSKIAAKPQVLFQEYQYNDHRIALNQNIHRLHEYQRIQTNLNILRYSQSQ